MHNKIIGAELFKKEMYYNIKILDTVIMKKDGIATHIFVLEDGRLGWFNSNKDGFYMGSCYIIYAYNTVHFEINEIMCDTWPEFSTLWGSFKQTLRVKYNLPENYTHVTRCADEPKLIKKLGNISCNPESSPHM